MNRGRQLYTARRSAHLVRCVENVGSGENPIERRIARNVDKVEQRQARQRAPGRKRGGFVIQPAKIVQVRECPDLIGSGLAAQMLHPVIGVTLDAGAAQQSGCRIDGDAHGSLPETRETQELPAGPELASQGTVDALGVFGCDAVVVRSHVIGRTISQRSRRAGSARQ